MTLEIDRIYCGDCLDLMREMPDKSVDLVLTDPPYGIGEAAGKNKTRGGPAFGNPTKIVPARDYGFCEWDNMRLDGGFLSEMRRVSKNQIVFGGNYYADLLDPSSCWIVTKTTSACCVSSSCSISVSTASRAPHPPEASSAKMQPTTPSG